MEIAVRCGMFRYEADGRLLEGHVLLDEGRLDDAQKATDRADALIKQMEYGQQIARLYILRSRLLYQQGKLDEAIRRKTHAMERIEEQGQWGLLPELERELHGFGDNLPKTELFWVRQQEVLYERINTHFTALTVHDYKKLKNIEIKKLSRINVFSGVNNSGKTSLLEAIYLLARQNDFDGVLEVVRCRGKISENDLTPEWMLKQFPDDNRIEGVFNGEDTTLSIRHYQESDPTIERSPAGYGAAIRTHTAKRVMPFVAKRLAN